MQVSQWILLSAQCPERLLIQTLLSLPMLLSGGIDIQDV